MTNEEFRARVQAKLVFEQRAGHRGPLSQTGEQYRELSVTVLTSTSEIDEETYLAAVAALAGAVGAFGQMGQTLYWRIHPEVQEAETAVKTYARFLFSRKPVIYNTEDESRAAAGLRPTVLTQ